MAKREKWNVELKNQVVTSLQINTDTVKP